MSPRAPCAHKHMGSLAHAWTWEKCIGAFQPDDDDDDNLGFSLVPRADDVSPRPILVVSDCTGEGAQLLVASAWAQFGSPDAANLTLRAGVQSTGDVNRVVMEASAFPGHTHDYFHASRALIVYTIASRVLGAHLASGCRREHIECFNILEPLLAKLEEGFGEVRCGGQVFTELGEEAPRTLAARSPADPAVFAVSCGTGNCTFQLTCSALRQFPQCGVREVTVCPRVRSLEEVRVIVRRAAEAGAVVVFTFASSGMARFMRRQCELAGVCYTDLFQPLLATMELYLDHPSFGVPGGLDLQELAEAELTWERRRVV
mmetsp:Transcript_103503/g.322436  ORF Transcript_103503/g.322436 Transcript_103503/m.322436 type:complete len:316 (+) Transcript_103503:145-1092(+)